MRSFVREVRRRHVDRAAIAYLAASWLLVQIVNTVLPLYGLDASIARWVVLALLIGFVPVLAFSWAFEWSPGGVRAQTEIDRESAPALPATSSRRLDRVIIGILAIAVLYFSIDKFMLSEGPSREPSIAVLPFDDLTPERDQAYFAEGLAEELLNLLAHNSSLKVAARTSSFRFRDAALSIGEIAEQLGVNHVLEGSVRRDGDRIRVTAQLIEAHGGFHVWSQTFDAAFSDIFSIQDSMSAQIAAALGSALVEPVYARETNPRAYTLFLQANYLATRGSERDLDEAAALLRQSLEIDPEYPPAWSQLARVEINRAANEFIDRDEGYHLGRDAALRSVAIDPAHANGYDQLAWVEFWYEADIGAAVEYARKALEARPNDPDDFGTVGVLLQALGQIDDAIALNEYAVARSPVDPTAVYNLALTYKYAGRLADAERALRRVLQLSPDFAGGLYHLGETLLLMGETGAAIETWVRETDDAYRVKGMALGRYSLGDAAGADAALSELIAGWGERWPSEVAHVYAWRGEIDAAFGWLERDYAVAGAGGWGEWCLQPLYANLHADPRWQIFLERVGVGDAQLSTYKLDIRIPAAQQ